MRITLLSTIAFLDSMHWPWSSSGTSSLLQGSQSLEESGDARPVSGYSQGYTQYAVVMTISMTT